MVLAQLLTKSGPRPNVARPVGRSVSIIVPCLEFVCAGDQLPSRASDVPMILDPTCRPSSDDHDRSWGLNHDVA
jgi:hypothetical protein